MTFHTHTHAPHTHTQWRVENGGQWKVTYLLRMQDAKLKRWRGEEKRGKEKDRGKMLNGRVSARGEVREEEGGDFVPTTHRRQKKQNNTG